VGILDAGFGLFLIAVHDGYGWFHLALGAVIASLAAFVAPHGSAAASDRPKPVLKSRATAVALLSCAIFALVVGIGGVLAVIFGGRVDAAWILAPVPLLLAGMFGAWFGANNIRAHKRLAVDSAN
jgi:hypothetical protein